ncbi:MAG: sn-glycerol-1-phosphate dehydrogenase [Crenarchaeota archaeon]|nr:sn-glycerol-1-phosphate dehydrogenase [Thermoproteota archaeon]MDW8034298.1 sn-glycerol-1-phosphate dehydrogenase [Nitrososphaerota archaeon]
MINLPRRIILGDDALEELGNCMKEAGAENVIVLMSKTPLKLLGDRIKKILSGNYFSFKILLVGDRDAFSEAKRIEKMLSFKRNRGKTFIVGVGGGRVIDAGKILAWRRGLEFASVPTVPSHDGIASPLASAPKGRKRYSFYTVMPSMIIGDVSILSVAPDRYFGSGVGDLVAKYTAVRDWRLSHLLRGEYYGEYAAGLAESIADRIMKCADIITSDKFEGASILIEALIHAGVLIGIAGSSRPCSGSEHLFSHALDLVAGYPALHGEQVGIGTIMMSKLHNCDWTKVRETLSTVRAPVTAKDIKVSEKKIIEALTIAHRIRPERYTVLGDKGLTKKAAEELAKSTMII